MIKIRQNEGNSQCKISGATMTSGVLSKHVNWLFTFDDGGFFESNGHVFHLAFAILQLHLYLGLVLRQQLHFVCAHEGGIAARQQAPQHARQNLMLRLIIRSATQASSDTRAGHTCKLHTLNIC